jgi:signal peptidase I
LSKEFDVPENSFFVLGDNRTGSSDSRHWQKNSTKTPFVPRENIRGKVRVVLWPINEMGITNGDELF